MVREQERRILTGISRSHVFQLERQNLFPKRVKLCGSRSVGWRLSELLQWLENRPRVESSSDYEEGKK
ncbi:hypothetical protein HB39_15610 [Vibrio parahaemolyticus]|nr:hypothetical protein HB39_15610 [Vibrio parahaemolyticus]